MWTENFASTLILNSFEPPKKECLQNRKEEKKKDMIKYLLSQLNVFKQTRVKITSLQEVLTLS